MDQRNVFYEEWLRSLRAHYQQVLRNDDRATLSSLTAVMRNVGFRDAELARLRIEATMHVDDVGEDFRADMSILDAPATAHAHPAECACPDCVTIDERQFDAEGQPLETDPESHQDESGRVFPVADIGEIDEPEETESVTFEDSVAADALPTDEAEGDAAIDEGGSQADPDAPEQMNLF